MFNYDLRTLLMMVFNLLTGWLVSCLVHSAEDVYCAIGEWDGNQSIGFEEWSSVEYVTIFNSVVDRKNNQRG